MPIDDSFPFYVLLESSGSDGTHDEEKMNRFLEDMMNRGYVLDGTVASEPTKIQVKLLSISLYKNQTLDET